MSNTNQKSLYKLGVIVLVLFLVVGGLYFGNLQYTRQNPGGNDFLVHWMGTRKLILEGVSPYSTETALAIQNFAYGRAAIEGEHELRVAYPLYSIVLFLPFSLIEDFVIARALWMTLLEVGLVLLAIVSARLVDWKYTPITFSFYLVFALLSYHSLRPVVNGNAVIIVALCISGALLALRYKADELAGVLLAFSTIKPQLAFLLMVFILIWCLRQNRKKVVGWFFATLILLILSAMLLIPDWLYQNFLEILRYPGYNPSINLQGALAEIAPSFGARIGWAITGILALVLLVEWGIAMKGNFRGFLWAAILTLLVSQWIGIPTDPGNFILLFPAIVLIFEAWERRWLNVGKFFIILCLVLLFILLWVIFIQTLQPGYQPQQSPVMFFPLPVFLWVMLYWSRWWILRTPEDWLSDLLEDETDSLL